MIEIRRDLYLDEETGKQGANFFEIKEKLHSVLEELKNLTVLR